MASAPRQNRISGLITGLALLSMCLTSVYSYCGHTGADDEYGYYCFNFEQDYKTFDAAQAACEGWEGNLASIRSAGAMSFVARHLQGFSSSINWWFGYRKNTGTLQWDWMDGEPELDEYFSTPSMTWLQAQDYCRSRGAELASVHNSHEESLARMACTRMPCWIGLRRDNPQTPFYWLDGTPTNYFNWAWRQPDSSGRQYYTAMWNNCGWKDLTYGDRWYNYPGVCRKSPTQYTDWQLAAPDPQPDNANGNENCAAIKSGDWFDEPCSQEEGGYICSKPSYECTDGQTVRHQAMQGYISDGPHPEQYSSRQDCYWVIDPPGNAQVRLIVDFFHTEENYDFLRIYDGPTTDPAKLLKICHGGMNSDHPESCTCPQGTVIESTGPQLTLYWDSDGCIESEGFGLRYEGFGYEPCEYCDADATCINDACVCNEGFYGDGETCTDRNECALNQNNCAATCVNTVGSYECSCEEGYSDDSPNPAEYPGLVCTEINECTSGGHRCSTHATCSNSPGSYNCVCKEGWSGNGVSCSDDDECQDEGNGNTCDQWPCANTGGSFQCSCPSGYTGSGIGAGGCTDIDECLGTSTCDDNAACTNEPGTYSCSCNRGYSGDGVTCTDDEECSGEGNGHNCDANARCNPNDGSFTCTCNTGWETVTDAIAGTDCQDIDECTSGDDPGCDTNGYCVNLPGGQGAMCKCNPGFTGDGTAGNCVDDNECLGEGGGNDCHTNANCANSPPGSYTCTCQSGYSGNGMNCVNVNECNKGTDDCDEQATCTDLPGSWSCACNAGWRGSGQSCTEIDECTEGTPCHPDAECANTPLGSYTCTCKDGYVGDGELCTDINECSDPADNDCDANAVCVNLPGSYSCDCKPGFTGDGKTCTNDDECAGEGSGNRCSDHAVCEDKPGSYTCTCEEGYKGTGRQCSNVNECDAESGTPCDAANGYCEDTMGSFLCFCNEGWELDPADNATCRDIVECDIEPMCNGAALCLNTNGSFSCSCYGNDVDDGPCLSRCTEQEARACHQLAYCEEGTCTCFAGLIGDGLTEGTGCDKYSYTVRFSIKLPEDFSMSRVINGKLKTWEMDKGDYILLFDAVEVPPGFATTLHHEVIVADNGVHIILNALFPDPTAAGLARDALAAQLAQLEKPTCFGVTLEAPTYPLEPRVYRWVAPTSAAEIQIAPTGMSVENVHYSPSCGDAGCWVVDVIYATGADSFNTFYIPHAVGDETVPDFEYNIGMSETYAITAEETYLPMNHPCRTFDYVPDADTEIPNEVTACCIPEFLEVYRPIESFVTAVSSFVNTECLDEGRIPLFMPGSDYPVRDGVEYAAKPLDHLNGRFKGLPNSYVEFTGILDPFIRQFTATFYLDELELRRSAGILKGTVGVEYTIDTFVGLANFKPTGIEFLDPLAAQVNLHLERTQFFAVSTHGSNDYTFLEYVNLRLVSVYNEDANFQEAPDSPDRTTRTDPTDPAHYLQVTFTLGPQYEPNQNSGLIPLDSVQVGQGVFIANPTQDGSTPGWRDACQLWTDGSLPRQSTFAQRIPVPEGRTSQLCAPAVEMCVSPLSLPDSFAVFNVPLGVDWLPSSTSTLEANVFVSLVVSAIDTAARAAGTAPNDGEEPWQMKTTLKASIPVVDGGINIFCDGIVAKTDLKDVADVDLVIGSAASMDELSRLTIYEDIASSDLEAVGETQLRTASIESGFMTLVLKGNASYFGRGASAAYALALEDVITLHIMENAQDPVRFNDVKSLLAAPGEDNYDAGNALQTEGYAINGAFAIEIDRALNRARLQPTAALLNLCAFRAPRPTLNNAFPATCILRRDVEDRAFPVVGTNPPTAIEVQPLRTSPNLGEVIGPDDARRDANGLFMQTVLGGSDFSFTLGKQYGHVIGELYGLNGQYVRAFWINPGYEWTPQQTGEQSIFTISQKIVMVALVGMDEGFTARRRVLLQSTKEGSEKLEEQGAGLASMEVEFDISRQNMIAQAFEVPLDNVATFTVEVALSDFQACMDDVVLREELQKTLEPAVKAEGVASALATVQVVEVEVQRRGVACRRAAQGEGKEATSGARRLQAGGAVARAEMMVVFEEAEALAFDVEKFVAASSDIQGASARSVADVIDVTEGAGEGLGGDGGGNNTRMIVIIAGAVGGFLAMLLCACGAYFFLKTFRDQSVYVDAVQVVQPNKTRNFSKAELMVECRGDDDGEPTGESKRTGSQENLLSHRYSDEGVSYTTAQNASRGALDLPSPTDAPGPEADDDVQPPPRRPPTASSVEDIPPPPRSHASRTVSGAGSFRSGKSGRGRRDRGRDDSSEGRRGGGRSRSGEKDEKRSMASSQGRAPTSPQDLPPLPTPVAHYDMTKEGGPVAHFHGVEQGRGQPPRREGQQEDLLASPLAWMGLAPKQ